ncbi:pyridoxal phosphate-dependent transferase [Aspergillus minisclerotigenes]|uniref:Pyridoxal phosphate-dependent transferase n=1 Tax=Aspergillus minisclerotigenes TaxID=656917 RepID=A0A5N6J916_9EURO|nr:pyridoxal phosphate-dependent transferase [Aspergillus minisclerotigenes]
MFSIPRERDGGQANIPVDMEQEFIAGKDRWMSQPELEVQPDTLRTATSLFRKWTIQAPSPFNPLVDELWVDTAKVLREAGLPWHSNNVNLPDDIDPSWPLHFKQFEEQVVNAKGARVGDPKPVGYVCCRDEATLFATRALQQELRASFPNHRPLLVASRLHAELSSMVAEVLGLEHLQVIDDDWLAVEDEVNRRDGPPRALIVVATTGEINGQVDDFGAISQLLMKVPGLLHVDATRNFDLLTTLTDDDRQRRRIPRLNLRHPPVKPTVENGIINAGTIVAGGMHSSILPYVVVLKPRALRSTFDPLIEYVRGTDSTISGSRDSIPPLLAYLQELRFGARGIRDVYRGCQSNREVLYSMLLRAECSAEAPAETLDLMIKPSVEISNSAQRQWGLLPLADQKYLLTMQPSVTPEDINGVFHTLTGQQAPLCHSFGPLDKTLYPISNAMSEQLRQIVRQWQDASKLSGGFPLNHATYATLSPVIRHFFPLSIPSDWARSTADQILEDQKSAFGLSRGESRDFSGSFTSGSTMGNRIGIHTALQQHPNAILYFSSATHYSVRKVLRDNDEIMNRWVKDARRRFTEVPCDDLGRMRPDSLAHHVKADKARCISRGETHSIVLLVNIGTTFSGARDDILALREALRLIGSDAVYIHADGALDLATPTKDVCLGPPHDLERNGKPVVQGVTLSHHKAFGIMVSGEVICYTPTTHRLAAVLPNMTDPRAVFETWLFHGIYPKSSMTRIWNYCMGNAGLLRDLLAARGIPIKFNTGSLITVLPRPPISIIRQFHLAPEGDWVHFITMPHITPEAIKYFVERIAASYKARPNVPARL